MGREFMRAGRWISNVILVEVIAPRVRELVQDWSTLDRDRRQALELCEGMDLAREKNEPLRFT